MFTIRTATRVLFAAVVLAVIGSAQAADKPKSVGPPVRGVQEELKIKSFQSTTKPFADGFKPANPKGSGPKGFFDIFTLKGSNRPGK